MLGPTEAGLEEACLVSEVIALHGATDGTYGSPRVTE